MHAIKSNAVVGRNGRLEVENIPLPAGTAVEIIVLAPDGEEPTSDLMQAAKSSTDFWHNEADDRVWNDA